MDRAAGTRQEQQLSGLAARHPVQAGPAVLGVASMVGLPPTLGFAAKEGMLEAFTGGDLTSQAALAAAGVAGSLAVPVVDRLLLPYAEAYPGDGAAHHLALWHGFTPALGFSALALAAGGLLHGSPGAACGGGRCGCPAAARRTAGWWAAPAGWLWG